MYTSGIKTHKHYTTFACKKGRRMPAAPSNSFITAYQLALSLRTFWTLS